MKLAIEMAIMDMDGEYTAVAVGADSGRFRGMLRLNDSGAEILRLLEEETTEEELLEKLGALYDESTPEEIAQLVSGFLARLRDEGLLAE